MFRLADGLNYNEIESNSVGYKEDYTMYSLDFEEFLWVKGYRQEHIEELYRKMLDVTPLSATELDVLSAVYPFSLFSQTRNSKYQK